MKKPKNTSEPENKTKQAEKDIKVEQFLDLLDLDELKNLFELAPDAYYLNNYKGTFIEGNRKAVEISGYTREELLGKSFLKLNLLTAKGKIRALKHIALAKLGKATGPSRFTFRRKDGELIPLEIATYPTKINGKNLVLGTARDISDRIGKEEEISELNKTLEIKVEQRTTELSKLNERLHEDIKEKKKMEDALQESESHLRQLIDNATDLIYKADRKGNFTYFNPYASDIMKISSDELLGKNYLELIREDFRGRAKNFYTKQIKENIENTYFEFPVIRGDGSQIWLGQNVRTILEKGKVVGIQSVARDITIQKEAETALSESERRYRAIFEDSRDVIYLTGLDGSIIEMNKAGLDLFGYTQAEISNLNAKSFYVKPEDRDRLVKELETNGYVTDYELKLKNKDGNELMCLISSTIRPSADGGVRIQGIIRDISKHREAENALLETERRFRDLLENLEMIALLVDTRGNVLFCNQFLINLTGYEKNEILGHDWFDLFVQENQRENRRKEFKQNITSRNIPVSHENDILTRNNGSRTISWTNTSLLDSEGQIIGTASIGSDITDRLESEEQLRHAQRLEMIGNLTGGIAHDFNNALTPIVALSQMQLNKLKDEDPQKEILHSIYKSATRATDLTSRLMAFGRKQVLEPKIININNTLLAIGDLVERSIGEQVTLRMKPKSGLWNVKADMIQIEQVIMNLVLNAKDALDGDGIISIKTENTTVESEQSYSGLSISKGDYVKLCVIDNGPGMTDDVAKKIFEPFFTTKDKDKGTGLGLSVVYGIVKQHKGDIRCISTQGEGTTFEIYFPRSDKPLDKIAAPEPHKDFTGSETILLVEDDDEVRQVLSHILKELGYVVIEAENGEKALDLSKKYKHRINLLLSDLILPGANGREISEMITAQRNDISVLFISGYSDDVIAKKGMLDEGIAFVQKPFTASKIGEKIRELLEE